MYVITYDISVDKLRNKVAKLLEGYGRRVQYSCFECNLTEKQYTVLQNKLEILLGKSMDGTLRIYDLCANCEKKITTYGELQHSADYIEAEVYVI